MALNKVAAETHVSGDGALEVDFGADGKRAEVRPAKGFGCDADFKTVGVKGSYGETGSCGEGGGGLVGGEIGKKRRTTKGEEGGGRPLTEILSPRWASPRISAASVMVREVPPPPVAVSSWGTNDKTAAECSELVFYFYFYSILFYSVNVLKLTSHGFYYSGKHVGR